MRHTSKEPSRAGWAEIYDDDVDTAFFTAQTASDDGFVAGRDDDTREPAGKALVVENFLDQSVVRAIRPSSSE
jgi:hypothetical protein